MDELKLVINKDGVFEQYNEPYTTIEVSTEEEFRWLEEAVREKLEREKPKPLTIEELIQMQDQPVWVKYLNAPELDRWGIVESASEIGGEKYLYFRGEYGYVEYEKGVVAYRHKPKEVSHGE